MTRSTALILACAALLSACAAPPPLKILTNVTVFHQMPAPSAADATYAVLAWRKENQGSLEHEAYGAQVAAQLRARGLNVVAPGTPARFAVYFDFGIDDGRTETSTYSVPTWGVTGYAGSTTSGTVNRVGSKSYINTATVATPAFGVTGYNQMTRNTRIYHRFLKVDIVDLSVAGDVPKKIYQGALKSDGQCGNLPNLMPAFVNNLLGDFPGVNGTTRNLEAPAPTGC